MQFTLITRTNRTTTQWRHKVYNKLKYLNKVTLAKQLQNVPQDGASLLNYTCPYWRKCKVHYEVATHTLYFIHLQHRIFKNVFFTYISAARWCLPVELYMYVFKRKSKLYYEVAAHVLFVQLLAIFMKCLHILLLIFVFS